MGSKPNVMTCLLQGITMSNSPHEIRDGITGDLSLLGQDTPLIHFVEDRYITLKQVLAKPELAKRVKLYLVDYGYNTQAEREEAYANPNITVLDPIGFSDLLKKFCVREG